MPKLVEGEPSTKPLQEDAAHFLVRQVQAHPHEVTIYAAGPLTNIALALSIDPHFAEQTNGIVIMGGSLSPQTNDPEFVGNPRREFNFWFDPEAAHITLRAHWPRIDLTTVDISVKTAFTKAMLDDIARSPNPAAKYLATYTYSFSYCWDELAAAAWLDPAIITKEETLYVDVNLGHGPFYGDTVSWRAENKPAVDLQPVHVQKDLDLPRFNKLLIDLMKAPPSCRRSNDRRFRRLGFAYTGTRTTAGDKTLDIAHLNEHFGIPGVLAFHATVSGLIYAGITSPLATATVYLQGAHVTAWQPKGQQPAIFVSRKSDFLPGKPIRGGVPIAFPWFAARHDGKTGPSHGFAVFKLDARVCCNGR